MVAAPDQFNHERWSRIARRTGLYEYISSTGYVGPHLYSARMLSAIRRGLRHHRLRGFISETAPAWGFDAPMLWELPQMLWDPGPLAITPLAPAPKAQGAQGPAFSHAARAGALRMEFCRSAFGPAWEWMLAFFDLCEEAWAATRDQGAIYERSENEWRPYPDRRLRSGASSGIYGDGYGGRGGKISTLDGFLEMPSNRPGNRIRLLRCWDFLNEARTFAERGLEEARGLGAARVSEAERVLERVQLFRRSFGLTLLIGLWYEPVYKAFKEVRRLRFDLVGMRQMYGVVDNVMYTTSQSQSSASGFSGQVSVLTGYSEQHPSESRLNLLRRGIALGADIKQAFARQIQPTSNVNGLRSLRNQVHRYLALSLDSAATDLFPTFMARAEEVRGLSDVGLGLFASRATALADNAPFPRDGADIEGPHRLIGLEAFYLKQYIDWWNRIPQTGATPEEREDALSERIRLLTRSDIHPTPDPGFGWCFTGLREIAGCVAMHGFAEMAPQEMAARASLLANIVRG